MKSNSDNSGKQKPRSDAQGDERPPNKVQDAALTFIQKLRQADPTQVPAFSRCDVDKRSERSNIISNEQAGNRPLKNVPEAALTYIMKLRESGCERPVVRLAEIGSSSFGKPNPSSEQAAKNLHDATFSYIKRLKETEPTWNEPPKVKLAEKSSKTHEHIAVSQSTPERSKTTTPSSSLPPRDSPLTKAFAGQYVSSLVEETIRYLRVALNVLAKEMLIPEMVLRDVVQGKLGMTRGQWIKLGKLLKIATNFQLVKSERNGTPCWEICFPPVALTANKT